MQRARWSASPTPTPGTTIYYTIDGKTPTMKSLVYNGPITIASTETVKAYAAATNYSNSAVGSATFTITPRTQTPTLSVPTGTYESKVQTVTISDAASGATIYYTLDGSTPNVNSPLYNGPLTVYQ